MQTIPSGIVPPVVTPFLPDGALDVDSLDRVVDHLLDAGVHGLFVLGSTGEVAYLTDAMRSRVIERIASRTAGRVPVIVGCMELTAARVADQARRAADSGADALVATAPIYALNDDAERLDHFRTVAAATPLPLLAYDIPVRVHQKLSLSLLVELAREGIIAGVKDSSGDDVSFRRLVRANEAMGHPLTVMTGHEVVVDGMLLLGADGVVPGFANVDPASYVRMWEAAAAGDWMLVRQLQDRIAAAFEIVFQSPGRSADAAGVGAFKVAMQLLGVIDHATMAHPVQQLGPDAVARIQRVLESAELLSIRG